MRKKKRAQNQLPEEQESKPIRILRGVSIPFRLIFGIIGTVLLICVAAGVIFAVYFANYLQDDVLQQSDYSLEGVSLNQTSYVYYQDKASGQWRQLQRLYASENRIWADFDELPENMIRAAVAIEDKRFYKHQGVDWSRTISASLNMFVGNGDTYGGSTITQQLIKNLTKDDDVTVRRKLLEIFRALEFEKKYTKDEIIEWYLNTIYLGEGCYGVKSAANVYFAKPLDELTLAECACLVGITNNPSLYDPYINLENNRERQLTILQEMLEQEYITQAEYDEAVAQEMVFQNGSAEDIYVCGSCGEEVGEYSLRKEEVDYTEDELEVLREQAISDGEEDPQIPASYTVYYCPNCDAQIDPSSGEETEGNYSYFTDTVIRDVVADLQELTGYDESTCEQMVLTGGYRIYATIDMEAQEIVDSVYEDIDNVPSTTSNQQLQSAIVVIDNESGDIVAMAGGVGEKEGSLTLNRATQGYRSPGSSIKPITVYAPALEYGVITPYSTYEDSPYKDGWPHNQGGGYSGLPVTVSYGVAQSLNTVAVKVLADLGVDRSFRFATEKLGMSTFVEEEEIDGKVYTDRQLSPLALGSLTHGTTVRDMATAYATFPNNGVYRHARTYTKVVDSEGNVVLDNTQEHHVAMKESTAWYMTYLLQNAVQTGTGTPAQLDNMSVAGKTGTTSDDHDRYFSGYTPYYTAAVWCGFDIPEEIVLTGSWTNPSVVMWRRVMSQLNAGLENRDFFDQGGMTQVAVCKKSGLLATNACWADPDGCVDSTFVFGGNAPKEYCSGHTTVQWCEGGNGVANNYCAQVEGNSVSSRGVWGSASGLPACSVHGADSVRPTETTTQSSSQESSEPETTTTPNETTTTPEVIPPVE